MKKVIALSTVLGLSALGMACGDAAPANNANKPANTAVNTSTPAPVNVAPPAANVPAANAPAANGAKPAANAPAANATKPAANTSAANTAKPANK